MKIHSLRVDDFSVHNKIVVFKMAWHAHNAGLEDPHAQQPMKFRIYTNNKKEEREKNSFSFYVFELRSLK